MFYKIENHNKHHDNHTFKICSTIIIYIKLFKCFNLNSLFSKKKSFAPLNICKGF